MCANMVINHLACTTGVPDEELGGEANSYHISTDTSRAAETIAPNRDNGLNPHTNPGHELNLSKIPPR